MQFYTLKIENPITVSELCKYKVAQQTLNQLPITIYISHVKLHKSVCNHNATYAQVCEKKCKHKLGHTQPVQNNSIICIGT